MNDQVDDQPGDPAHGEEPEVGSLGEEAARLMDALAGWARQQGSDVGEGVHGLADAASRAARDVDGHLATGAPECTYCPVCRVVHVVRSTSPEVRTHLAVAASSLLQAAAGLLATHAPAEGQRGAGVERIGVDGDGPWEGEHGEYVGDGEDWEDGR